MIYRVFRTRFLCAYTIPAVYSICIKIFLIVHKFYQQYLIILYVLISKYTNEGAVVYISAVRQYMLTGGQHFSDLLPTQFGCTLCI